MPLEYLDEMNSGGFYGPLQGHSISRLVKDYTEAESCTDAVSQSFRVVDLLLLSNHLEHANTLGGALYKHIDTILPKDTSRPSSAPLRYFWFIHPAYPRPDTALSLPRQGEGSPEALKTQAQYEHSQWQSYRECTRTGWMLDHCKLAEPEDPHVWRETDDAPMIAMCARLLAKDKTPGQYPPVEQLREALAASEKLYAQPQIPISEWVFENKGSQTVRRHSYLLYRRLVVELAIRVGELDKACRILSQGLLLDGFMITDGASLDRFLMLPGIYDVLPLLATKGKAGNPYHIEEEDAASIAQEIVQALEHRAEHGRQWSLAPGRIGWRELLDRLATAAWIVNSREYQKQGLTCAADILNDPALEEDITAAEAKVGPLPDDLKDMFRIADGFKGGWHFLQGGLGSCKTIDFASGGNLWEDMFFENDLSFPDHMSEGFDEDEAFLEISPASRCDGFSHCFISPTLFRKVAHGQIGYEEGDYRYMYTSGWLCENVWFKSVREWIARNVEVLERRAEDGDFEHDPNEDNEQ